MGPADEPTQRSMTTRSGRAFTFNRSGYASTALAVGAFGIAMGYLEGVVVVYLRTSLALDPSAVHAHDPGTIGTFEAVEVAREIATLVMILAVGWLAGRSGVERLAWTAVVFGAWDIVYYVTLRVTIEWPPAIDTWDVLFLVPRPWVGPVWAPLLVSCALVVFGLLACWRLRTGGRVALGAWRVLAGIMGGGLVIASFLLDAEAVLVADDHAWTGWPFFGLGMVLATSAAVSALTASRESAF